MDQPKWMRAIPYACALAVMGFFSIILVWIAVTEPERRWWVAGDLAVGISGLVLLRARHRAPFAVALITAAAALMSTTVIGPAFVAYVSLTKRRRWGRIVLAALLLWTATAIYSSGDGLTQQLILAVSTMTLSIIALTVAGLYLRSRRDLETERANRRAQEQLRQLEQLEQARLGERARIAREMHDVLAHRNEPDREQEHHQSGADVGHRDAGAVADRRRDGCCAGDAGQWRLRGEYEEQDPEDPERVGLEAQSPAGGTD